MRPLPVLLREEDMNYFLRKGNQKAVNQWLCSYVLKSRGYVNVRMKWKKDTLYDHVDVINRSKEMKTIVSLKNIIVRSPEGRIPIHQVSKMDRILEIHGRVAAFLRKYPSIFHEEPVAQQKGHEGNMVPWFSLTPAALALHHEECKVFEDSLVDIFQRLRCLILMTKHKVLPLQIVKGMLWYLGFPEDFTDSLLDSYNTSGWFRVVEMGNDVKGLSCCGSDIPLSVFQKSNSTFKSAFPLYPSKGVRLKRKIADWLEMFQKIPYVSPYEHEHCHGVDAMDVIEKRVVGVLHELLALFVDHSAERRRLLCLKKHLGLPHTFGRAFERHPHIFYLHLKNKTCTVVLKEAYNDSTIPAHPMLPIREKYVMLIKESETIIRNKRSRPPKGLDQDPSTNDVDVVYM